MRGSAWWPVSGRDLGPAALAGGALVLAFPSADLGWLAFVALAPWLVRIPDLTPRAAAVGGLASGLVFYLGSLWWIAGTMVRYGDVTGYLAIPVAAAILLLLALYLGLFTAAFAAALAWVRPVTGPGFVLAAATLWVALEYGRAHLLSGFPWNLLGYSQYRNGVLLPVVTVTGVYGLSFLVMAVNAALAWGCRQRRHWRDVGGTAALAAGIVALALVPRGSVPRVTAGPRPTTVALVQGNIAQELKWDPARQLENLVTYQRLSLTTALERRPALIVWPETAVPFSLEDSRRREPVLAVARAAQTSLVVGAPHVDRTAGRVFNSAFLVDTAGAVADRYDKVHLVPFGEYVPLRPLLFFADWFVTGGIGEFTPGPAAKLFSSPAGRFGVTICYEAIFPELVRLAFADGAEFLVNLTNDAWFGQTAAPYQHLAMATVRAVENQAYVVRAANTGISAIIAPDGRIVQASGLFTREVVAGAITPRRRTTFYTRYGDVFARAALGAALLGLLAVGLARGFSAMRARPSAPVEGEPSGIAAGHRSTSARGHDGHRSEGPNRPQWRTEP